MVNKKKHLKKPYIFRYTLFITTLIFLLSSGKSIAQEWTPVENETTLHSLFDDTEQTTKLTNKSIARATYNKDGTGTLYAWGETFKRQWKVENSKIIILIDGVWREWSIERNTIQENTYRATPTDGVEVVIFTVEQSEGATEAVHNTEQGDASQPSADELAKALANPNAALAKITTKLQIRTFEGTLLGAEDQTSTTLLLQPSFPFPTGNGDVVLFRPAIPFLINQPVYDPTSANFNSKSGLGDIAFDLAYGKTNKETGLLTAFGMIATLPTATSKELGGRNFNLGPELLIGLIKPKYVLGAFPNHQWKIAGSGATTNLTTIQVFANLLPGKAWVVGTAPLMNYDWTNKQWTIPINLTLGKTYVLGGRPWSFSLEANYFVEKPEAFGSKWFIGFGVTPVVQNIMAKWFK